MKHFNALTPLIFIKNACDIKVMLRGSTEAYDYIDIQYGSTWYLFAYLAASVVITIVAYILYKRKQNETVHEFIAVPLFKPLFTIGASFFPSLQHEKDNPMRSFYAFVASDIYVLQT